MDTKVNISQAPWQACECGNMTFVSMTMVKRLSALMSPDSKEHFIPVEIHICKKCEKVPSFIHKEIPGLPEELKAVKPIIGDFAGKKE